MTVNECKKDAARRLASVGVSYGKLTAKTVSFAGFGYGFCVFVKICGPVWSNVAKNLGELKLGAFADVPKPSAGGYVIDTDEGGFA